MANKNLPPIGKNSISEMLEITKLQTGLLINCIKIGTIVSFTPETQRAEVSIAHKQVVDVLEDGTRVYQEYPAIKSCPVVTLFGGVDFLSMPIQVGDNCLVLFNDNELDQWSANGDGGVCSTFRTHDLSDGIVIVGVRPLINSISGYLTNGIRLSHGGGNVTVDLKDGLLETLATLFLHHGNMEVTGNATIGGTITSNGGGESVFSGSISTVGAVKAGNGATGTFGTVTVVDGIVTGGS